MKKRIDNNYIAHVRYVLRHIYADPCVNAYDVAIYFALFRKWNNNFFNNFFIVSRLDQEGLVAFSEPAGKLYYKLSNILRFVDEHDISAITKYLKFRL